MELAYAQIFAWLARIASVLIPISGFLMVVPIFGNRMVTGRVKLSLLLSIALVMAPLMPASAMPATLSLSLFLDTAWLMLVGIGLGFATLVFFQIFVIAGQFLGMQMGLGFAAMVDPGNGIAVTVWSQFFLMLVTLVYLALNGHLVTLEVLLFALRDRPELLNLSLSGFAHELASLGGWMFLGGALVALPAVCALLIVNLAFGVMSRSAPQLNVFALGFPFSLVFGLVVIWMSLKGWMPQFERLAAALLLYLESWVG